MISVACALEKLIVRVKWLQFVRNAHDSCVPIVAAITRAQTDTAHKVANS